MYRINLLFAVFFVLLFCGCSKNIEISALNTNTINLEPAIDVVIPKGNELEVSIKKINRNKSLVIVKNVSDKDVFCSYQSDLKSNKAFAFAANVEMRKNSDADFKLYSGYSDYAPGVNVISPQSIVEFEIPHLEKGEYRINFGMMIDKNIRQIITDKIPEPGLTKKEDQAVDKAWYKFVTPIFKRP